MASDYLSSDLRHKVEELKNQVANSPTSVANLRDRAEIAWEWANAFSMTGAPLPVDCSFFMASIFVGNDVGEFSVLRRDPEISARDLDEMLEELSLKEKYLNAFGSMSVISSPQLRTESLETLKQAFTVGKIPLVEGGGLLIARNGFANHGLPQSTDPGGENYVTIECSNSNAVFVPDTIEMRGLRGGIRAPIPVLLFRLIGTSLTQGEKITITYGDRTAGGSGFRVQSTSTDSFKLPVYIDFKGNNNFFTLDYPSWEILGQAATAVHCFGPGIVSVGEVFELTVRFEDKARNRAIGRIPGYRVFLNDSLVTSIESGETALKKIPNLKIDQEGTFRFKIVTNDGLIAWSDPIWVKSQDTDRIYWGDLHGHCEFADGQGSPDGFFEFGRDDAQLDFLCLSEHDIFLDDFKWQYLQECLNRYEIVNEFIPILAYEYTAPPKLGGHHNVYFRNASSKLVGLHQATDVTELFKLLKELNSIGDVLVIPHAHQAGDWRKADKDLVAGVEIASQHGSFEWFGLRYLQNSSQVGFVGGSDNHQGHPGYSSTSVDIAESLNGLTAAWAKTLSSEDIFSAIRDRKVYATTGERILMDISVDGVGMGGIVANKKQRCIEGAVSGTGPLSKLELRRADNVIYRQNFAGKYGDSNKIRIAFCSTSEVAGHDNPRGYIVWKGWISLSREIIKRVDSSSLFNWNCEYASLRNGSKSKIDFEIRTRGHSNSIFVELEELLDSDEIDIHLEETKEIADSRYIRERDVLEATDIKIKINEFAQGAIEKEVLIGSDRDFIQFEIVDPDCPWDANFKVIDSETNSHMGEHYLLYVEQQDGAQGWSSSIMLSDTE
jgi:hypothetical protein